MLQAMVNNKMGGKSLSLEEQRKRGLIAAAFDGKDEEAGPGGGNDEESIEFSNPVRSLPPTQSHVCGGSTQQACLRP